MTRVAPLFALLLAQGCFHTRTIGLSKAELVPKTTLAGDCLAFKGGPSAELIDGTAEGKEAVSASGAIIGLSPVFVEKKDVDGLEVWGGQECVMGDMPFCDNVVFVKKAEWRYFVRWARMYESPQALPATPEALIADVQLGPVLAKLRALELDERSMAALAAIADARRTGTFIRAAGLLAGAAAQGAGMATGTTVLFDSGKRTFDVGLAIGDAVQASTEAPILAANPELLPLYEVVATFGLNGLVCVARPKPAAS